MIDSTYMTIKSEKKRGIPKLFRGIPICVGIATTEENYAK